MERTKTDPYPCATCPTLIRPTGKRGRPRVRCEECSKAKPARPRDPTPTPPTRSTPTPVVVTMPPGWVPAPDALRLIEDAHDPIPDVRPEDIEELRTETMGRRPGHAVRVPVEHDASWRDRAECADADPELFFTDLKYEPPPTHLARVSEAKALCSRCPVTQACLTWAITMGEEYGVWGGLDERERRALAHRQAAGHGQDALAS